MTQPTFNSSQVFNMTSATAGVRTVSVTVPSLTNGCVVVKVATENNVTVAKVTGVSGVGGTAQRATGAEATVAAVGQICSDIWGVPGASTGAASLAVAVDQSAPYVGVIVEYWENVNQSTPFGDADIAVSATTDNTIDIPALTSTSNDVGLGIALAVDPATFASADTAITPNCIESASFLDGIAMGAYATSTNPVLNWTTSNNQGYAASAAVLQGTGGGGGNPYRILYIAG